MAKRRSHKRHITTAAPKPTSARSGIAPQNSWGGLSPEEYNAVFFGNVSRSGALVTEKTALSLSAVFACVNLLCGALVSMPISIYMEDADGTKHKVPKHPYKRLLNLSPNPAWTAATFWIFCMFSRLFYGDVFVRIVRKSLLSPEILYLEPIHPKNVDVQRIDGGLLLYTLRNVETIKGGKLTVDQSDMIHITGLGFDGLRSLTPIKYAIKNVGGAALAVDEYSATYFKNNATPSLAVTLAPGDELSPDAAQQFRDQWAQKHAGVANSHVPTILKSGMKVEQLSLSAEDAQLIATRNFQVEDICRVFGVPPFMIGHTQNTSSWGTGVEQMGLGFLKYTMQSHLTAIEQEIDRKIWSKSETNFSARFNTAGLERGDIKTRNESYRIAAGRAGEPGWMTINEIRALENLPPIAGGDVLFKPTQGPESDAKQKTN